MKQNNATILKASLLIMGITGITTTAWAFDDSSITLYAGAGYAFARIDSPDSVTQTLYKGAMPNLNATLGLQFGEYVGFEVGMEPTKTKTSNNTISAQDFPGIMPGTFSAAPQGSTLNINTKLKIQSIDMKLMGRYPLNVIHSTLDQTAVFFGLGISYIKASTSLSLISGQLLSPAGAVAVPPKSGNYATHKLIPMAQMGFTQNITSNLALEASGQWKHLNQLKLMPPHTVPLTFKNTVTAKLGILYFFQ